MQYIGLVILFLLLLAMVSGNKCPNCGATLMEYDDDPDHDYCPNGCDLS